MINNNKYILSKPTIRNVIRSRLCGGIQWPLVPILQEYIESTMVYINIQVIYRIIHIFINRNSFEKNVMYLLLDLLVNHPNIFLSSIAILILYLCIFIPISFINAFGSSLTSVVWLAVFLQGI